MKKKALIVGGLFLCLAAFGCQKKQEEAKTAEVPPVPETVEKVSHEPKVYDYNPTVVIETDFGNIEMEVYVDKSPIHAKNFLKLVDDGFYDELTFHRVIAGFVIQGGDPFGTGSGGPGYTLEDEQSGLKHVRGAVAMARSSLGTSGSQFYITLAPQPHLDAQFNVFAMVTSGMDVVDKIAAVPTDPSNGKPKTPVKMKKVYVKPKEMESAS